MVVELEALVHVFQPPSEVVVFLVLEAGVEEVDHVLDVEVVGLVVLEEVDWTPPGPQGPQVEETVVEEVFLAGSVVLED